MNKTYRQLDEQGVIRKKPRIVNRLREGGPVHSAWPLTLEDGDEEAVQTNSKQLVLHKCQHSCDENLKGNYLPIRPDALKDTMLLDVADIGTLVILEV